MPWGTKKHVVSRVADFPFGYSPRYKSLAFHFDLPFVATETRARSDDSIGRGLISCIVS